jgi:myo-inositol-1(or 4)-monophosphatase
LRRKTYLALKTENSIIKFIIYLVEKSGEKILKEAGKITNFKIKNKNPKDIVTKTDIEIENFIKQEITKKFPSHYIVAEESFKSNVDADNVWYIDPIDGTTNFLHNFPIFGVSVAYTKEKKILAAAIYFPVLKELFWATKNGGAFKNNKKIYVSKQTNINNALLSTGFACLRSGLKKNNLKYFNKIIKKVRDIRRTGSACFDMCSVASGRLDGFWELNLSSWDVTAGTLIVEEAGGKVTDFSNTKNFLEKREIVATNGKIHNQLLSLLK